jgi:MFS family permease
VPLSFETLVLAGVVWCAGATSFGSYMAARILTGFFASVASGGALMFIKDIYFFHQHARKIKMWVSAFILSPFLGPLVMALIIAGGPASGSTWPWGSQLLLSLLVSP